MIVYNLSTHPLWGRTLAKFPTALATAYADDGYIKGKLSVALQVWAELTRVFQLDAGLDMNVPKTTILTKSMTPDACLAAANKVIAHDPTLSSLQGCLTSSMFSSEGMVGLGVPIGTDSFVQDFVAAKCREIIDDVDKLDSINDGFIHYQLTRFCQATRLQFLNSHILLQNRCPMQQQHVDTHITNALLKKGAGPDYGSWNRDHHAWARMVMHLPHDEGGFGVCSSNITMNAAYYTSTSRFIAWLGTFTQDRQNLWMPHDNLADSATWNSPQLLLLSKIHQDLLVKYNCKETDNSDGGSGGSNGGTGAGGRGNGCACCTAGVAGV